MPVCVKWGGGGGGGGGVRTHFCKPDTKTEFMAVKRRFMV